MDQARQLDTQLFASAQALGRVHDLKALAHALSSAVAPLEGVLCGALCVVDEERGGITAFLFPPTGAARAVKELALSSGELDLRAAVGTTEAFVEVALSAGETDPLRAALAVNGASAFLMVPIRYDDRFLGALVLGQDSTEPIREAGRAQLRRIADLSGTPIWACFAHDRFRRGDRRRDALVELSSVINTSLELEVVLDRTRRAVGALDGHAYSWIALLNQGSQEFRRFERPGEYPIAPSVEGTSRKLETVQVLAGSVVEALLEKPETMVSADLRETVRYTGDRELAAEGVRRYVVAPLRVGGETIGAFLFGSREARAPRKVDLWLVENVSLQLALAVENARRHGELQRLSARTAQQNVYLTEELQREHNYGEMVGSSRALREVCSNIERVARTESTVLVMGPTGVGKELVARAIHAASRVADQPMVKLNCAAIAEGMVESELFGHERGAFTSAVERRIGRFELAQDGTLFLDEIGELPLSVQTKLLRVLQDGEFERVGGTKTLHSSARIVAATNRDLFAEVEKGTFRADLFYRLNVFPIEVPALEERPEDVPLLANFFVQHFNRTMGKSIDSISPESLDHLLERDWPGNVRELKHVIERAVILSDGPVLVIEGSAPARRPVAQVPGERAAPLRKLKEMEALHIQRALEASGWVVEGPRGAAEALGLKGSTLRFRMSRLGISRPKG